MSTTRELALEAAVRFTDRARYSTDIMLKNAELIENWLNRDLDQGGKVPAFGKGVPDEETKITSQWPPRRYL